MGDVVDLFNSKALTKEEILTKVEQSLDASGEDHFDGFLLLAAGTKGRAVMSETLTMDALPILSFLLITANSMLGSMGNNLFIEAFEEFE